MFSPLPNTPIVGVCRLGGSGIAGGTYACGATLVVEGHLGGVFHARQPQVPQADERGQCAEGCGRCVVLCVVLQFNVLYVFHHKRLSSRDFASVDLRNILGRVGALDREEELVTLVLEILSR